MMPDVPSPADSYTRLHRAGWSIGDIAFEGPAGRVWVVSGMNGENRIRAEGKTDAEAWQRACEQAAEVGMLGRGTPVGITPSEARKMVVKSSSVRTYVNLF